MLKACSQDSSPDPREAAVQGGQDVPCWAWVCLPSGLFLSLPSALHGRE